MNHLYYDTSNLNAPYDDVPLQGLGGGILSAGPIGSLGADTSSYPWKSYSADTKALQDLTNQALKAHGYCPVNADGKLGPATCGAVKVMLEITGQTDQSPPSTCQGFTAPSKQPCLTASPAPPPASASPAVTTSSMISLGGKSDTLWLVAGAVVAVGAIGAALYFTKKRP